MSIVSEPFYQTLALLILATCLQITAAIVAACYYRFMQTHALSWTIFVCALLLMVHERTTLLEMTVITGIYDYKDAAYKAAISLLLLAFLFGYPRRECRLSSATQTGNPPLGKKPEKANPG